MPFHSLRRIWELRKTKELTERTVVGRLFYAENRLGIVDESGVLWPIEAMSLELAEGDVISCRLRAVRVEPASAEKALEELFLFRVEMIGERTPCRGDWPNAVIPSPIPERAEFVGRNSICTKLYPAPSAERMRHLRLRQGAIERTRAFFASRGFCEMETPSLVPSGGVEAYLNSFASEYRDHRGKSWPLSLPTSPEFALKKLLAEGFRNVFQIAHSFRNGGELARWHEPEFLMLEWYRTGGDLESMMRDTRCLVEVLADSVGTSWDSPGTWPRYRVDQLFREQASIELSELQETEQFRSAAAKICCSIVGSDDWDSIFFKLFFEKIEPFLLKQRACFVTHYPRQMGALARVSDSPLYVERFECYLDGVEICNAYHELTDTIELERRFALIGEARSELSRDAIFEQTMRFGLPPSSGNALGLDRVICILSGRKKLADLFPVPFLSQFPFGTVAPE